MNTQLIGSVLTAILGLLPKETGKELVDGLFDKIEDVVQDTGNDIDDVLVLPIVQKLREILDIPDFPDN